MPGGFLSFVLALHRETADAVVIRGELFVVREPKGELMRN